jgi:hypothetical protein
MQRLWPAIAGVLCLLALASARAQSDERLDKAGAPHGGQMQRAEAMQLELLVEPEQLVLYVTDHARSPIQTDGGSAKAIITGGKDRYVVILSPGGENVLKGSGEYELGAYNLISLMVALPDRELQHLKFVHPKGAKPPPKKAKKSKKKTAKKSGTKKKPPTP